MGKILFMRIFLVLVSCAPSRSQNRILNYTELANISNNILSSPADYEDYSSGVNYQDYSSVFEDMCIGEVNLDDTSILSGSLFLSTPPSDCSSQAPCVAFNYSVMVNNSESNFTGIMTLRLCMDLDECRAVSCSAALARSRFITNKAILHPGYSVLTVNNFCSRTCCNRNRSCITITQETESTLLPEMTSSLQQDTTSFTTTESSTTQPSANNNTFTILPCGFEGSVSTNPVRIVSPGYPNFYPDLAECQWRIRTQTPGNKIRIQFESFNTEQSFDFLRIFENKTEKLRLSGAALPSTYVTMSDNVMLTFTADDLFGGAGFVASIEEIFPSSTVTHQSMTEVETTAYMVKQGALESNNNQTRPLRVTGSESFFDEDFLPSCSVGHALSSAFRCERVFSFPTMYRGPATCRKEISEMVQCVGQQLALCRMGGLRNVLDQMGISNFNSEGILQFLFNFSNPSGDRPNNVINTFCFHAGLNLTYPHPVETHFTACQAGFLQRLLVQVRILYYRYAWARDKNDICRAYRAFKQWFLATTSSMCDFLDLQRFGYSNRQANYLQNVARAAITTVRKLDSTSCRDSAAEASKYFKYFSCKQRRMN